ncbi:MAG: M13 family metallopeptidase [Caulobacterales bacterium]
MKTFHTGILALAGAALLSLASLTYADPPKPQYGAWGFDLSGRDTSMSPGADFFAYANGGYMKAMVIPADRSSYGAFDRLEELSTTRVHEILEKAAANPAASGDEAKIGAFYRAFMDEKHVEALGDAPLRPELGQIRAAADRSALAAMMGKSAKSYFGGFFDPAIEGDEKDPDHYAVYLEQAGLGLPDRDYYLQPQFAAQRAKYQAYVAQMLALAKWPNAEDEAKAIVAMETQIAKVSWTRTQQRDPDKSYTAMTPDALAKAAPGFDWRAYLNAADVGSVKKVVLGESTAFPQIAQVFASTPLDTLKAWEAFNVVDSAAPYLSKPFVDAHFEFRAKVLAGQEEQRPRWKRAAAAVGGGIGEAVGRVYVAQYFPPQSKAKVEALVANIRTALAGRIERLTWMSDATKAKALEKLSKLTVKIGYPAKWRDYSALTIRPGDLYGDVERSSAFEWARQVKRLNGPVDRGEWELPPQAVNAYYETTRNEIVFPAAILQPPFFDPDADPAVNYGGIGAVIGHETTHGFDDEGRKFDGDGRLADWWTAEDAAKFGDQTKRLGAQYSAFEPVPGAHVNGDLTMGENIADLGGVLLALDAYHLSLGGRAAPVIDGLTGDQRLFLGFGQIWRGDMRPDFLRLLLVSDPHAPNQDRVNGVARNVDAWYDAWGIKPGDPLYVPPDLRVRIW